MNQSKRKILYLVTQSEWGGAQEYVYNLATNLDKNQGGVLVLAGSPRFPSRLGRAEADGEASKGNGPLQRSHSRPRVQASELFTALESQNLPYQTLKWARRAINPLFDLLSLFELIFVFKKEHPDVIHLNSSKIGFLGSLAACWSGLRPRPKVIYTAHGWVFNEPLPYLIKKLYFWIEKISASWKDVIICVAEADRQIALANNFKSKIVTIHNAVDPAKLNFLDKQTAQEKLWQMINAPRRESVKIIGAIANLYPAKGISYLIKAAAQLVKQNHDLVFMVMGQGQEQAKLQALINNNGLAASFFLLGGVFNARQYLKAFDLFVLPSVKEGLPYALLYAQAAGLPIVAAKVGAIPEILPLELLAEPGNAGDLADKINDALNNPDKYSTPPTTDFTDFLEKTLNCYQ